MFNKLMRLLSIPKGMRLISALGQGAEAYAYAKGKKEVGAEHLMQSAIDLPDGSAKKVFEHFDISPEDIDRAIERQYSQALESLGLDQQFSQLQEDIEPKRSQPILFPSGPSAVELMQKLAADRAGHRPLLSAHVLSVIASLEQGVAARTLTALGINKAEFESVIQREISRAEIMEN